MFDVDFSCFICLLCYIWRQKMTEAAPSTIPPPRRGVYRRKPKSDGTAQDPEICIYCEEPRPVHFWKSSTKPVCIICYQKHIKVEPCSMCGEISTVRQRDEKGGAICHACYQQIRPDEICRVCKKLGKIVERFPNGKGKCSACYQRERRKRLKEDSKPS